MPDIARSKVNQAIKFGQLIEYNMRNVFLKKSCANCGGETSHKFFPEILKLSISLNQQSEVPYSLLLIKPKHIETEVLTT